MARPFFTAIVFIGPVAIAAAADRFERPPVNYSDAEPRDPVALCDRLDELVRDGRRGYLDSVLDVLDVPASSQVLVYSKTSLQIRRITPEAPRAVYFNDDVYVGYCFRGDVIEIAATDPQNGARFYTLNQRAETPAFEPDDGSCLACHATRRTQDVPGYLVRSVHAGPSGQPVFSLPTYLTEPSSPHAERWGGWVADGFDAGPGHMANRLYEPDGTATPLDLEELRAGLLRRDYLRTGSDPVALLVLAHQSQMHNAIAAASIEARIALDYDRVIGEVIGRPADELGESTVRRLDRTAENVVRHLLMCDEAAPPGPLSADSDYAKQFAARGPFDPAGRSLREFDLESRVFKYPCSYLIYSPAFDALPREILDRVRDRLAAILDGEDESAEYAHLTPEFRDAVGKILRATKPGLWR